MEEQKIDMPPLPQEEIATDQEQQQQPEPQQATPVAQEKHQEESSQAKNFRQLREKAERAERERLELLHRLEEYQKQARPQQSEAEEDLSISLGSDDFAEGKHLSKLVKTVKKLEAKVAQYEQKSSQMAAQALLKAQYPDFEQVVNSNAIEMLKNEFPETAASLAANPDELSRAVAAYKLIKRLGYTQDTMPQYNLEKERIDANLAKPRALSSIAPQQADSPLSRVNAFEKGLTSELQQQLWKEMQEAMGKS